MAIDIKQLNYDKSRKYLPQSTGVRTFQDEVLDLLEHDDFWQNARRYSGPLPAREDWLSGMEMLRKSYGPILKVRECHRRHVRGVISREPQFESVLEGVSLSKKERSLAEGYQPNDVETLADEADRVQGEVWDDRGEHKVAKKVCGRLLATSSAFLRYDIPPGRLKTVQVEGKEITGVEVADWREAYSLTHMELCPRNSAAVIVDPATMREIGFYSYQEPDETQTSGYRDCVQISAVDEAGLTQVRIVKHGIADPQDFVLDTGGWPLVMKAEVDPLVTKDLLQLQDTACSIATMVKINADVAGFPQKDTIDVEEVFKEVPDPDNPGQMKRVSAAMPVGPRVVNQQFSYLEVDEKGDPLTDEHGKPYVRTGKIQYRSPVSSQPLRDDIDFFNTEIYRGMNQAHIATQRSANSSAELLVQERADYADSLLETKPDLERLLRNVFKARLCMAAYLARDTPVLKQFKAGRIRVDLRLNAGPISVEQKTVILAQLAANLMTKETAMVLIGDVDDVEAERVKLDKEAALPENLNPVPVLKTPVKPEVNK